jgi:co-chaperonin GroES (HSP10)
MNIQSVIGLRILVAPSKEERVEEKGSILIVEDKAMRPKYGTVFQVGGLVNTTLVADGEQPLTIGDSIAYDRTDYATVNVAGKDYELITKQNLIGICG